MATVAIEAGQSGAGRTGTVADGRADRAARLSACLERARGGDRSALDQVVRELNPLLWHVARSQGLDAEQAADVVQTTWLALLRQLDGIRSPQALTGWLVTTARREAWQVRDRARRLVPDDAALEAVRDPDPGPDERLLVDERDRVLWSHFQRLPERCRALLRLVAQVRRPDYTVVTEALGMPHGSIGPTRGRCLAKLREMLLGDPAWIDSTEEAR
jgi:RNA polymerase sigma factor (sigma-70 family)